VPVFHGFPALGLLFFFEKSLSLPLESLALPPRCHRVPHRRG
jgi:hypothetical protein